MVKEAIEFERYNEKYQFMQKVFRVTAIRNNEELMSWEILDNAKGKRYYRSANSSKLTTFRWPFFSYAYGSMSIVISPLADPEYIVHQDLPGKNDGGRIQRMDFSHDGNLFVLVYTEDREIIYKIAVKDHFHRREARFRENLARQVSRVDQDELQ